MERARGRECARVWETRRTQAAAVVALGCVGGEGSPGANTCPVNAQGTALARQRGAARSSRQARRERWGLSAWLGRLLWVYLFLASWWPAHAIAPFVLALSERASGLRLPVGLFLATVLLAYVQGRCVSGEAGRHADGRAARRMQNANNNEVCRRGRAMASRLRRGGAGARALCMRAPSLSCLSRAALLLPSSSKPPKT